MTIDIFIKFIFKPKLLWNHRLGTLGKWEHITLPLKHLKYMLKSATIIIYTDCHLHIFLLI